MKNRRILIISDYFFPAKLAGGPTVSCDNLVKYLGDDYEIFIYCSSRDLDKTELNVEKDHWLDYFHKARILYGNVQWGIKGYLKIIKELQPDVIHINGIYSLVAVVIPLIFLNKLPATTKIIISPRGMLQTNALKVKRLKKILYLSLFRRLLNDHNISWHVTSELEKSDLLTFLSVKQANNISVIGNVPSMNIAFAKRSKDSASLKILTVAIVSPMKNILNVLRSLRNIEGNIVYTLYGMIKDENYWDQCLAEIKKLPTSVTFKYGGIAERADVNKIMSKHDVYVQPSRSENFSHSIFEALMSGMPVITSHNTPWDVKSAGAGWNVDPENLSELSSAIFSAKEMTIDRYTFMQKKSRSLAKKYLSNSNLKEKYHALFE